MEREKVGMDRHGYTRESEGIQMKLFRGDSITEPTKTAARATDTCMHVTLSHICMYATHILTCAFKNIKFDQNAEGGRSVRLFIMKSVTP